MRTRIPLRCRLVFRQRSLRNWKLSWDLIFATFKRVNSDKQLKETFLADLQRLMDDEDSFQWPLDDPHFCLLLGHMRDYHKRFLVKLSQDEDQDEEDDTPDSADWWKETE
jgi:hypothetical protein